MNWWEWLCLFPMFSVTVLLAAYGVNFLYVMGTYYPTNAEIEAIITAPRPGWENIVNPREIAIDKLRDAAVMHHLNRPWNRALFKWGSALTVVSVVTILVFLLGDVMDVMTLPETHVLALFIHG